MRIHGFFLIVSPLSTFSKWVNEFNRYKLKYLVVDEGHRLKNVNCKLLKNRKLLPVGDTLLLTGTPLHNNLRELWSLLNFILPQLFTSLREFESWVDFYGRQMNETVLAISKESSFDL